MWSTYYCYPKTHRVCLQALNVCLLQFDTPHQGAIKTRAPFLRRKQFGPAQSLVTIQFGLWSLLRYVLHHVLFPSSYINQKTIPCIKQLPGAQALGMQRWKQVIGKHHEGRLHVSNFKRDFKWPSGLFISWWPNYGMELSSLGNKTWSHGSAAEWVQCASLAVFPELLTSMTFAGNAQSLDFFLQLTFASWNPSAKLTHSPGKLKSRHIHISWKSNFRQSRVHAFSEDEDIEPTSNYSPNCGFSSIYSHLPLEQEEWESSVLWYPWI